MLALNIQIDVHFLQVIMLAVVYSWKCLHFRKHAEVEPLIVLTRLSRNFRVQTIVARLCICLNTMSLQRNNLSAEKSSSNPTLGVIMSIKAHICESKHKMSIEISWNFHNIHKS